MHFISFKGKQWELKQIFGQIPKYLTLKNSINMVLMSSKKNHHSNHVVYDYEPFYQQILLSWDI